MTPQLALGANERPVALLPAADARTLIATLTVAECAVVGLLASGRVPKQAARDLSIALATVRSRTAAAAQDRCAHDRASRRAVAEADVA